MDNQPKVGIPDIIFFVVSGLAGVAALMLTWRAIESGNTLITVATLVIAVAIEVVCWRYWMRRWRKQ
jgi:uncharacterized membrane protein